MSTGKGSVWLDTFKTEKYVEAKKTVTVEAVTAKFE
jgi:hypothetical protein